MAEALGLMANISQVTGGVGMIIKLAKILRQYQRGVKWASEEIQNIVDELERYQNSVTTATSAIDLVSENPWGHKVVLFLESNQFGPLLAGHSVRIQKRVKEVRENLPRLHGSMQLWNGVKWISWKYFYKDELIELSMDMEGVKSWLTVILCSAMLAVFCQNREAPGLEKRIADLEEAVRSQVKSIQSLEARLATPLSPEEQQHSQAISAASEVLLNLARSIVTTGEVPEPSLETRTIRRDGTRRKSHHPATGVSREPRRRAPRPSVRFPPGAETGYPVRERASTPEKVGEQPEDIPRPVEEEQSPSSRRSADHVQVRSPLTPPLSTSASPKETEPPTENRLDIRQPGDAAIPGYIAMPIWEEPRYVTAIINRALDHNLITVTKASELGLEIKRLKSGDDRIRVEFNHNGRDEQEICQGTVELIWSPGIAQDWRGSRLQLYVCGYMGHGIILGKPSEKLWKHQALKAERGE